MPRLLTALATFCGLFLLSGGAVAAEAHAVGATVLLNSVPILCLKADSHYGTPAQQAAIIVKHLRSVDDDAEVKTVAAGRNWQVVVGTTECVTITPEEAEAHKVSVQRLADQWASTIRDALALPPLKFSVEFLRLPLSATKQITLVGSLASAATLSSTNESVATVKPSDGGFTVTCLGVGDAQLKAVSGNSMRTLDVSVRPMAGSFPQSFTAEITGAPALASLVQGAVQGCIRGRLLCLPGASCSFDPIKAEPLGKGETRTYSVKVLLRAKDAFDSAGNVTITVHNLGLPAMDDTALWYSNAPESVQQIGPLFASFLKLGAPIRFLYHHDDATTQPIIIRVEAINDSDDTARVLIAPGDTKPDKNPVRAGMTAANQYFHYWSTQSGEVVSLPPHSTFPISIRRVSPKETISGLCSLRLLSGPAELLVRADALPAFDLGGSWYDASLSSTPWREAGTHPVNDYDHASYEPSSHVYPDPYKLEKMDYTVGDRSGYLLIGQKPIQGEDHTNNLDGNFGVLYKIKATIKNPTDTATDVDLVFEASAGYMGGLFLVDGTMIQTPLLSPKNEVRLGRFHLARGATRTIDIVTLPVSGGSYPATLFLRPVG